MERAQNLLLGLLGGLSLDGDLNTGESSALLGNTLVAASTGSLGLVAVSLSLVRDQLGAELLSLGLVDVLHKDTLVLEDVTLSLHVQDVVQVLVDLASLAVLAEKATKDTLAAHPDDGGGHTGLSGTLTLTSARVTTSTLGSELLAVTEKRVHGLGLLDDKTILDELADVLA